MAKNRNWESFPETNIERLAVALHDPNSAHRQRYESVLGRQKFAAFGGRPFEFTEADQARILHYLSDADHLAKLIWATIPGVGYE